MSTTPNWSTSILDAAPTRSRSRSTSSSRTPAEAVGHHRPRSRAGCMRDRRCWTWRTAAATSSRWRPLVNAGLLDPYQLILKVHTKRSDWREDHADLPGTGDAWRDRLLGDLLGDAANVRADPATRSPTTPDLGLVTGDGSLLHARVLGRQPGGHGEPPAPPGARAAARRARCSRPDRCTGSAASSSRGCVRST